MILIVDIIQPSSRLLEKIRYKLVFRPNSAKGSPDHSTYHEAASSTASVVNFNTFDMTQDIHLCFCRKWLLSCKGRFDILEKRNQLNQLSQDFSLRGNWYIELDSSQLTVSLVASYVLCIKSYTADRLLHCVGNIPNNSHTKFINILFSLYLRKGKEWTLVNCYGLSWKWWHV